MKTREAMEQNLHYYLCNSASNRSLVMKGEIAESKALGHSSCGRWPQPDIATSLYTNTR